VSASLCFAFALLLIVLLPAGAADAQEFSFPRLGLSAAPDRYEPVVQVHGRETFEVHVIVLPPAGEKSLDQGYTSFHWALLEPCCGGAAEILSAEFNPAAESTGVLLGGVVTSFDDCAGGEVIHLGTLTARMLVDLPGEYWSIAGPLSQAQACDQEPVVMTDMVVYVNYTTDVMPVESTGLSGVKALFRE
jgi:hypothetical protein